MIGRSDIDECATEKDECNENAACTNNVGSYTCAYNIGFEGTGRICEDRCARLVTTLSLVSMPCARTFQIHMTAAVLTATIWTLQSFQVKLFLWDAQTLTNALITQVMLMEHVPIPMALIAVLVMMVTLVTDSHVKTLTNVALVYVVTTLLSQIAKLASHAPTLLVSRVVRWTAVLTLANVVTLILTHVTLTLCTSISKADIHVNVLLDTLVMALNALISTNVPIPKMYQLTPL